MNNIDFNKLSKKDKCIFNEIFNYLLTFEGVFNIFQLNKFIKKILFYFDQLDERDIYFYYIGEDFSDGNGSEFLSIDEFSNLVIENYVCNISFFEFMNIFNELEKDTKNTELEKIIRFINYRYINLLKQLNFDDLNSREKYELFEFYFFKKDLAKKIENFKEFKIDLDK